MPQPESCSSDWWISGLSASRRSWRTEIGSAATQPKTRHMRGARTDRHRLSSLGTCERSGDDRAETDLVGTPAQALRAGAAGRARAKPQAAAPRGPDRVPEGGGGPGSDLAHADTPQPRRL